MLDDSLIQTKMETLRTLGGPLYRCRNRSCAAGARRQDGARRFDCLSAGPSVPNSNPGDSDDLYPVSIAVDHRSDGYFPGDRMVGLQ